jgi:hypothetical protein
MSTRNHPRGKGSPACKAENHTFIYEPIIYKMLCLRWVTTLLASIACYCGSFFFFLHQILFSLIYTSVTSNITLKLVIFATENISSLGSTLICHDMWIHLSQCLCITVTWHYLHLNGVNKEHGFKMFLECLNTNNVYMSKNCVILCTSFYVEIKWFYMYFCVL